MRRLAILGSTGSIGTQTLDVVRLHPGEFQVVALSTNERIGLLRDQVNEFKPKAAVIARDVECPPDTPDTRWQCGLRALEEMVTRDDVDLVIVATVGAAGVRPTMAAIKANKNIALANKEVLVMAGEVVMDEIRRRNLSLTPIDGEHSAILQCLNGENPERIKRLLITASGGPFREKSLEEMAGMTVTEALAHPTWNMGRKITIDSATLMNKGFEVIEARHLFNIGPDRISIVIHPQSIVHSLVEYVDGSMIAHVGPTDMRLFIQYAISYPDRYVGNGKSIDLAEIGQLTFERPAPERFPCLRLAYEAIERGGTTPACLSVANEIAVGAFLNERIGFLDIPAVIEESMARHDFILHPSFEEILAMEGTVRFLAEGIVKTRSASRR